MKKNIFKIGGLSLLLAFSFMAVGSTTYAKEVEKNVISEVSNINIEKLSAKEVENIRQKMNKELDKLPVYEDKKSNELSSNGKKLNSISTNSSYYPTRAGIILVTTDGSFGSLVGHAGIIWSSKTTIESFPSTGVKKFKNDWDSRYKKVWAVTTKKLIANQENAVSNWCANQVGKPYNWEFTKPHLRNKFYCSQLVYAGFLDKYNLNLNYGSWIVFPYDLVRTNNTYIIYKK